MTRGGAIKARGRARLQKPPEKKRKNKQYCVRRGKKRRVNIQKLSQKKKESVDGERGRIEGCKGKGISEEKKKKAGKTRVTRAIEERGGRGTRKGRGETLLSILGDVGEGENQTKNDLGGGGGGGGWGGGGGGGGEGI